MKRQEPIASSDFVNAKVRGMRSALVENDRLLALADLRSLTELARRMHPDVAEAPTHVAFQRRCNDETTAELNRLARFLAGNTLAAYEAILLRYPLDVLKVILRAHAGGRTCAGVEALVAAMPYGLALPLDRLFDAQDLRRFAEDVPVPLFRVTLRDLLKANDRPDAFVVEAALDSAYFKYLLETARRLDDPVRRLVAFDADARNVLLALRAKFNFHWEYDNAEDFLVPSGIFLGREHLRALFAAVDVTDAVNRLPLSFIPKAARLTATTATQLEDALLRLLYARARSAFAALVLDEGVALAYAYVRQTELLNLTRLSEGVRHSLTRDEIVSHLLLLER